MTRDWVLLEREAVKLDIGITTAGERARWDLM